MVRSFACIAVSLVISGCAGGSLKPTVPGQSDGRKACPTSEGVIIDIIDVTIEGPTEIAQGAGAAFGGYVGNRAAKDESDVVEALATGIGVVAGSMAGDLTSKTVMSKSGQELMIYVNGTTHSIVQQTDARQPYSVGDDVWVVGSLSGGNYSQCKSGIRVLIKK